MTFHHRLAFDRKASPSRTAFIRAKKIERGYTRQLRKIARHVGDIVNGYDLSNLSGAADAIRAALERYASLIAPWAASVGARMVAETAQADRRAWMRLSQEMGRALRREIDSAPTGHLLLQLQQEQIEYITSIPRDAGERVQKLALEGLSTGRRYPEIVKEILASGSVSRSRAELIAATETAKASSMLVQARAEHVGSTHYAWETTGDEAVRPSHRAMQGKIVAFNDPPTLDGLTGHAGQLPRCRCFMRPILTEED